MRDRRRLRGLRVGVRGEHVLPVRVRQIDQHLAEPVCALGELEDQAPLLHAVHRHVDVVARPRGVEAARGVLSAGLDDQAFDEEEEILAGAVVPRLFHPGDIETVERVADDAGVGARHDLLIREHDQVGVVDGHERSEELRLRVLEVLVEDAGHVFGIEAHVGRAYLRPRLRRFASRRYAPSVPAGNWRQRPRPM